MRDYAQIKLAIWNDDQWRALSVPAQMLYLTLLSHPSLLACGVGDWRPGKLAGLSAGWDRDSIADAASELVDGLFILIDEDTEEYLIRSYVRHDGVMKNNNLPTTMARSLAEVGSNVLRGVVVFEVQRLHADCPDLIGWKKSAEARALLDKAGVDPAGFPLGRGSVCPTGSPKVWGSVWGKDRGSVSPKVCPKGSPKISESRGKVSPTGRGRVSPSPIPVPTTNHLLPEGVTVVSNPQDARVDDAAPSLESLDESAGFAFGTPHDPRCRRHKDLPREQVPACGDCARAREVWQAREREADEQARRELEEARAEAAMCCHCDDTGMANHRGVAYRCDHTGYVPDDVQALAAKREQPHQPPDGGEGKRQADAFLAKLKAKQAAMLPDTPPF